MPPHPEEDFEVPTGNITLYRAKTTSS